MRILMLTHNPVGKGADYWRAFYLSRQLVQRDHSVTLVGSPDLDDKESTRQIDGLSIRAIPEVSRTVAGRTGYSPMAVFGRLVRLRGEEFDLVHTFGHRPAVSLVARWLKKRTRAMQVADWSDLWGRGGIADERRLAGQLSVGLVDHWFERRNVLAADGVATVSRFLESRAHKWGKSSEKVCRLGVGAADDVIRPVPKHQARAALDIASDQRVLVHSGRSTFDSGHVRAVYQRILEADQGSNILLLGGDQWSKGEAADAKFHDRTRHLGYLSQDQMRMALGACDAVLLPLRNRGFNQARLPNRVGDAAAAGRPIATNPTGDIGSLVRDEGLGIVAAEDPASMAADVVALINDQEKLTQIGRQARIVAETELSWSLLAERLVSFYERLSSNGQREVDGNSSGRSS